MSEGGGTSGLSQWAVEHPIIENHVEVQASTGENWIIPLLYCFCDVRGVH